MYNKILTLQLEKRTTAIDFADNIVVTIVAQDIKGNWNPDKQKTLALAEHEQKYYSSSDWKKKGNAGKG